MKNSTNTPTNLFNSQMKQAKTGWVINISSKQKANNVVKENKNGRS